MFIAAHVHRSANLGDVLRDVPPVSTGRDAGLNGAATEAVGRICGNRAALLEKCLALQIHSLQTRMRDRLELIARSVFRPTLPWQSMTSRRD